MKLLTKTALTIAAAAAVAGSIAGKEGRGSIGLNNLPSGNNAEIGYSYDLTGNTVYGSASPVSRTEKYISGYVGDYTATISRTDKYYTYDPAISWTVYTFEICKGVDGDDAWFIVEIGK